MSTSEHDIPRLRLPRLGLAVSMFDECKAMGITLQRQAQHLAQIEVVQSQTEPYPELADLLQKHGNARYTLLPNLDTRTEQDMATSTERFDIGARAMARNFSAAFAAMDPQAVDYVIGITGDTVLVHMFGIQAIIAAMGDADIAVSRAMGQSFHRADLTPEEMADPDNPKGGRPQDESTEDFMPQLFVARASLIPRLAKIGVTNRWCFEQCIGDAVAGAKRHVFSRTAYGFTDGVIYHFPSPKGWKHGR